MKVNNIYQMPAPVVSIAGHADADTGNTTTIDTDVRQMLTLLWVMSLWASGGVKKVMESSATLSKRKAVDDYAKKNDLALSEDEVMAVVEKIPSHDYTSQVAEAVASLQCCS